jgi:hypothetical protein
MDALWLLTILALAYAFAIEGFGKPRDDARHQGTDGGAASGACVSFHLDTISDGSRQDHG